MKIEKLTECLLQQIGPLFSAEFEQSEDANLHHFVSPARFVESIHLLDFQVVRKIEKTNRVSFVERSTQLSLSKMRMPICTIVCQSCLVSQENNPPRTVRITPWKFSSWKTKQQERKTRTPSLPISANWDLKVDKLAELIASLFMH